LPILRPHNGETRGLPLVPRPPHTGRGGGRVPACPPAPSLRPLVQPRPSRGVRMPLLAPPPLPSVTVPLGLVIPPGKEHYFDPTAKPVPYTRRSFEFRGERAFLPLVHAFLATCTAGRAPDYAYLFRLLGVELATNAIRHTNSGRAGGTFTLHVVRTPTH